MEGDRRTGCGWCFSVHNVFNFFIAFICFFLCVHVCVYNTTPVERPEDKSGELLFFFHYASPQVELR